MNVLMLILIIQPNFKNAMFLVSVGNFKNQELMIYVFLV
jgi:hypothetical protein